ncbi:helix-turn-helix domain-containing protein [Candidatus Protochlamydia naegleriophila]|nr:winged helix-turn-helix domain-containing protein [Candidatus Protochlamydia naegleriophila]
MTLGDLERAKLTSQHKQERDGRIRDRIKAVLLHDKGWSLRQIAEALLISDEAVRNHIQDYDSSRKLCPEGGGSKEKLSRVQSEKLELHLQKHTYLYVKDIVAYVEAVFGIAYTVRELRDWLQRHGFSYKKPAVVPGKANKEQQEKWLVEYNKLRQELPPDETICFIDGVHPTHNVQPAYGWIKKGVIYNTYYEHVDDFREAVFGFFTVLSSVTVGSVLGQMLRGRVRDKFHPIQAPAANF